MTASLTRRRATSAPPKAKRTAGFSSTAWAPGGRGAGAGAGTAGLAVAPFVRVCMRGTTYAYSSFLSRRCFFALFTTTPRNRIPRAWNSSNHRRELRHLAARRVDDDDHVGRGVEYERRLGGTADRRRVEEDQATGLPVRHERARERERGDIGRMPVGGSRGQIAELLDLAAAQLRMVVAPGPLSQAVAAEGTPSAVWTAGRRRSASRSTTS